MKKNIVFAVLTAFLSLTWIEDDIHAQCLEDFSLDKVVLNFENLADNVKADLSDYYFCESVSRGDIKMCDNIPSREDYRQNCYNDYKGRDVIFMKWASKPDYSETDIEECVAWNYLNIQDETQRRDDCAHLLAVFWGKDQSLCAQETYPDAKEGCYSIFYRDASQCDTISNPGNKSSCQARIKLLEVMRSGNEKLCSDMENPLIHDSRKWYYLCEVFFAKSCERPLQRLKRSYCSSLEFKKKPLPVSPDGSAGNE